MCWSRKTEMPPSTRRRLISTMASRSVPSGSEIGEPVRSGLHVGAEWRGAAAGRRPGRVRSTRPGPRRRNPANSWEIGPWRITLPRSTMATASQVRSTSSRRWDESTTVRPSATSEAQDHVAHVEHPGRVEAVHGLVEDEQLRIAEQAGGDAEALAHAHGVLGHFVVRPDGGCRRARATGRCGPWPPVHAPRRGCTGSGGRSGGRGSGARPRSPRREPTPRPDAGGRLWPRRNMVPASACVRPRAHGSGSSFRHRWAPGTRRRSHEERGAPRRSRRCWGLEALGEPVGLDGPLAFVSRPGWGLGQGCRCHATCPSESGGPYGPPAFCPVYPV